MNCLLYLYSFEGYASCNPCKHRTALPRHILKVWSDSWLVKNSDAHAFHDRSKSNAWMGVIKDEMRVRLSQDRWCAQIRSHLPRSDRITELCFKFLKHDNWASWLKWFRRAYWRVGAATCRLNHNKNWRSSSVVLKCRRNRSIYCLVSDFSMTISLMQRSIHSLFRRQADGNPFATDRLDPEWSLSVPDEESKFIPQIRRDSPDKSLLDGDTGTASSTWDARQWSCFSYENIQVIRTMRRIDVPWLIYTKKRSLCPRYLFEDMQL